jgi:hypothetical protein
VGTVASVGHSCLDSLRMYHQPINRRVGEAAHHIESPVAMGSLPPPRLCGVDGSCFPPPASRQTSELEIEVGCRFGVLASPRHRLAQFRRTRRRGTPSAMWTCEGQPRPELNQSRRCWLECWGRVLLLLRQCLEDRVDTFHCARRAFALSVASRRTGRPCLIGRSSPLARAALRMVVSLELESDARERPR